MSKINIIQADNAAFKTPAEYYKIMRTGKYLKVRHVSNGEQTIYVAERDNDNQVYDHNLKHIGNTVKQNIRFYSMPDNGIIISYENFNYNAALFQNGNTKNIKFISYYDEIYEIDSNLYIGNNELKNFKIKVFSVGSIVYKIYYNDLSFIVITHKWDLSGTKQVVIDKKLESYFYKNIETATDAQLLKLITWSNFKTLSNVEEALEYIKIQGNVNIEKSIHAIDAIKIYFKEHKMIPINVLDEYMPMFVNE